MLVSGVRSSCDMEVKNSLLAWLARCASASLRIRRRMLTRKAATKVTRLRLSASVSSSTVVRRLRQEVKDCSTAVPVCMLRS